MPENTTNRLPTPAPVQTFFKCLDDTSRPPGYVGDWPEAGRVYSGRVLPHYQSRAPHVHLDGFWAEQPWGAFAIERFVQLQRVWLN